MDLATLPKILGTMLTLILLLNVLLQKFDESRDDPRSDNIIDWRIRLL